MSVVIVTLNGARVIGDCLRSLRDCEGPAFEIIVVNNGSTDSTAQLVAGEVPEARLINLPENRGFAGGNNEGIRAARGNLILLLNDDTIVRADLLKEIARPFIDHSDIGIVGCKILYPDGETLQHAGAEILPNGMTRHFGYEEEDRGQHDEARDVDYVSGCAMAVRREVFEQVGLLDDRYFPIYYEETEFCVRARSAGWRVVYEPRAVLTHLESQTQERFSPRFIERMTKNRVRFVMKNFSARQMRSALKYELLWLWRSAPRSYLAPMARGYAKGLAGAPGALRDRRRKVELGTKPGGAAAVEAKAPTAAGRASG